jgi:integrase
VTLGRWPVLSVAEARNRARDVLLRACAGVDPREDQRRAAADREAGLMSAVVARYVRQSEDGTLAIHSWRNIERVMRLHVLPRFGDRHIGGIRRAEIHELLDDLVATGRTGTAREVKKQLARFYNWAVDRELVDANPVFAMKRPDLAPATEAGRALSDVELRAVWRAAVEMRYPFGTLYQLLMLTGQRRAEWARAQRSELNEAGRWLEVPRLRYKGRRDHIVPLSEPVWRLLGSLPRWSEDDHYLLSSQAGHRAVAGFSQGKARLDALAERHLREITGQPSARMKYFRVHDLRVTCETRLATLGFHQEVRDAVLGHAKPGLQKTYNKHDYLEEKRAALEAYGAHVMEVVG